MLGYGCPRLHGAGEAKYVLEFKRNFKTKTANEAGHSRCRIEWQNLYLQKTIMVLGLGI